MWRFIHYLNSHISDETNHPLCLKVWAVEAWKQGFFPNKLDFDDVLERNDMNLVKRSTYRRAVEDSSIDR
jgi:hypothetical protein